MIGSAALLAFVGFALYGAYQIGYERGTYDYSR